MKHIPMYLDPAELQDDINELTEALKQLVLWCPRGWSLELDQRLTIARNIIAKAEGTES